MVIDGLFGKIEYPECEYCGDPVEIHQEHETGDSDYGAVYFCDETCKEEYLEEGGEC